MLGLGCVWMNPLSATKAFVKTVYDYTQERFWYSNSKIRRICQEKYGKQDIYDNHQEVLDFRNKNIIVIFAEGFSTEWIDKYNVYKGLTPNITRFLEQSLVFDNYYNHTAATFRGLRGQLTSSYQLHGGYYDAHNGFAQISRTEIYNQLKNTLISLPDILKDQGYHTYFLSAHSKNFQLNWMLETLGFDRVYGAEDFHDLEESLTDQEIFEALSEIVLKKNFSSPYFIGVYNVGTHFGQDSPNVKWKDGRNILLNSIHNFDDAFGRFLEKMQKQKDLVIILTADHAAYPSSLYNRTFSTRRQYFLDKIPLIIWYSGIRPNTIDAKGRNSLDLAPTVLNALHINSAFNYFLGCSLFDEYCPNVFEHITCIGHTFYRTPNLNQLNNSEQDNKKLIHSIRDFFHLSENSK